MDARILSDKLTLRILAILAALGNVLTAEGQAANINALQFDAIVRVSSPAAESPTLLFVRYWIGTDYYEVAVKWAEPHGSGLRFPIYPPTLTIRSDRQSFTVADGLYPGKDTTYSKPLGASETFTNMYGDYPIGNTRFAEVEALATRIRKEELRNALPVDWTDRGTVIVALPANGMASPNAAAFAEIGRGEDRIDTIGVMAADGRLIKSVEYEYGSGSNSGALLQEKVYLAEKPVKLAMPNGGVSVKVGLTNYHFVTFMGLENQGGRHVTMDYEDVILDGQRVRFPVRIEVRLNEGGKIIRSAFMTNFHQVSLTPDAV